MKGQVTFSIAASLGLHVGAALLVPWPDGTPGAQVEATLVVLEIGDVPAAEEAPPEATASSVFAPESPPQTPPSPRVVPPEIPGEAPAKRKPEPAASLPPSDPVTAQPAEIPRKTKSATSAPAQRSAAGSISGVRYRERAALSYPVSAMRRRISGRVVLIIEVDAEGRATGVTVSRSSGNAGLDGAAIDCARRSSYEPYRINGVPRPCRVEAPFEFKVPDSSARPARN